MHIKIANEQHEQNSRGVYEMRYHFSAKYVKKKIISPAGAKFYACWAIHKIIRIEGEKQRERERGGEEVGKSERGSISTSSGIQKTYLS